MPSELNKFKNFSTEKKLKNFGKVSHYFALSQYVSNLIVDSFHFQLSLLQREISRVAKFDST